MSTETKSSQSGPCRGQAVTVQLSEPAKAPFQFCFGFGFFLVVCLCNGMSGVYSKI